MSKKSHSESARRPLLGAASVITLICAAPGLALAQQPATPAASTEVGEVIVTGSRVLRDGSTAPTPVTVLSSEQLRATAPTTLAEGLNNLPQFKNSYGAQSTAIRTNGGLTGGSFLSLRGLGPQRTLILLDGRRVVPSTANGTVDVGVLPEPLIKRVDVVTGGASAAYGSDAVTGVVNFVLNTGFEGVGLEAQAGVSERGDNDNQKLTAYAGGSFLDGRLHVIASGDYFHSEGMANYGDRNWARQSYGLIANPAGPPSRLITPNVTSSAATYGGLINAGPLRGLQFLPGGVSAPFTYGSALTATTMIGGSGIDAGNEFSVIPKQKRGGAFIHATYEVNDRLSVFVDGLYGHNAAVYDTLPNFQTGANGVNIAIDNAYLPAAVRSQMTAGGVTSFILTRIDRDLGKVRTTSVDDTVRFSGGFKADLGGGWKADAYYTHGENTYDVDIVNDAIVENFYRAADAVAAPGGQVVCRSTLTNPSDGCVPINLFGEGSPSAAAINYVNGVSSSHLKYKQDVLDLSVTGEPFSTWAGPVSVALGGSYRKESGRQTVDAISSKVKSGSGIRGFPAGLNGLVGGFVIGNPQPVSGGFNVKEVFAEVAAPLAKDMAFAKSLEVNAAIRYADYSTSGGVTTWKLGASYEPFADLRFRATRSRDVRAPNVGELFQLPSPSTQSIIDPVTRQTVSVTVVRAGSLDLAPEKADTFTGGVIYQPSWAPGLTLSADYFDIKIDGAITTLAPQDQVNQCAAGVTNLCSLITRSSTGAITTIFGPFLNAASVKERGVDLEAGYRRELAGGSLSLRLLVNYVDTYTTQTIGGLPIQLVDKLSPTGAPPGTGVPQWSGNFSIGYDKGPFSLFAQERYVGKGLYDPTFTAADINDNTIPAVFYTDVTARYKFEALGARTEVFATVNNLFDKDPPIVPTFFLFATVPTNQAIYDVIGRRFTVGVRARF